MSKRFWSLALTAALVAGVFTVLPAKAQEAPPVAIPAVVQIDDPVGDANGLNDQDNAYGTPLEGEGDHSDADAGTATDILKVWFSNTSTDISLNIQLEGNPGNLAYDTYFRFSSNAGEGSVATDTTRGCLDWIASVNGVAGGYEGETEGKLIDKCNIGEPVFGPLAIAPGPETTFVMTITFPRASSPLLADGGTLTAPFGVSRIVYVNPIPVAESAAVVTVDNTKRGTDYAIASGGPVVAPQPGPPTEPPGKGDPPGKGKKKGCEKGKGKKKGACPGKKAPKPPKAPVPAACPAYLPGEHGAEAETLTVTDAATEEAPVEVVFDAGTGTGGPLIGGVPVPPDGTTHNYHNVQVDSATPDVGLYVRLEFADRSDYDLYLEYPTGTEATHSGDFNSAAEAPDDVFWCGPPETGCSSGSNFESVNGVRTSDCQGWTIDSVAYLTEGGDVTLTMWLGEALVDPAPPAGEESAMQMLYRMLGL